MIDVNIMIPPMLEDIIPLEPQFPEVAPSFPLGILTPLDPGSGVILSGEERIAAVQFQIDVYDTRLQRCEETALKISRRLIQRGFTRDAGGTIKENQLHRRTMTFSAKIDEHTGLIYRS